MTLPAITREIVVDAAPDVAFAAFTQRIGAWWPVADHSVFGADSTVAFVDDQIVETGSDGRQAIWGTVTTWRPPSELGFTWHPGSVAERASRVLLTFTAAGTQTLVALRHEGWEAYDRPEETRDGYGRGWPLVLSAYATITNAQQVTSN